MKIDTPHSSAAVFLVAHDAARAARNGFALSVERLA
jgi:hypothetical protein